MIPILYDSNESAFVSNGLCRLKDIISCTVVEERNSIYECNFEYPVDGANYDLIKCGRIIAVVHDDTEDIQPFDIVSFSRPINGVVTFHAVHISYRQSKLTASGTNVNSLAGAFDLLKTATPSNPFTYWTNKASSGNFFAADDVPHTVRQMLGGMEGSILDCYGGEYEWDKWTVKLWDNRGIARDITIRYGINLMGYDEDVDYSEAYTSCIPFWVSNDNEQTVVKGNKVTVDDIPYNGRESCVPLDLTDKFEERPTAQQLQNLAADLMRENKSATPTQTIKVEFIRLQDSTEYASYANLMQCRLCDSINVVFPMYGTSGSFKIVKTVYDVLQEKFDSMELGTLSVTLSEALGINSNNSVSYHGSGGGGGVTGVKGDAELTYRTGNVNLTAANIGALPSNTAIHNVPSGGSTGQVLSKVSGTDYDLEWSNGSGVADVKVNGTSVVTSGVANIPVARQSLYGVVKVFGNTDPNGGVMQITYHNSSGNEVNIYTPLTQYVDGQYQPIKYTLLPDASQSYKGAMSAADKTKLDGIDLMTGASSSADGTGGLVPQPTTGQQDYTLFGDGTWDEIKYTRYLQSSNITFSIDRRNALYQIGSIVIPAATTTDIGLMTAADKTKLDGIASGAEVNVQSDWTEADSSSDAFILNKPTIPTVNNATLTIQKNGTTVNTFTANASSDVTANISVPTKVSDLTNDSGFITASVVYPIGAIFETTSSTVTESSLSTAYGGVWRILNQLKTNPPADSGFITDDGEPIYASGVEIETTYKWVRTA